MTLALNIDRARLQSDLRESEGRIRLLKAVFRESGQPRRACYAREDGTLLDEWEAGTMRAGHRLARLRARATLLCAIAAHARGRVHLRDLDREGQAAYIGEAWRAYEVVAQAA
jgi:hypothetical protein